MPGLELHAAFLRQVVQLIFHRLPQQIIQRTALHDLPQYFLQRLIRVRQVLRNELRASDLYTATGLLLILRQLILQLSYLPLQSV